VITQMSSERAVYTANRKLPPAAKWSRSLRIAIALGFGIASWALVVGIGYLIAGIL
jgi:hypothetical protein